MNRYQVSMADQAAYDAYVEELSSLQPHSGWDHVSQLPRLNSADYARILRANPDCLDDVLESLQPTTLADAMSEGLESARELVNFHFWADLQRYLKSALLESLQDYSLQQECLKSLDQAARFSFGESL